MLSTPFVQHCNGKITDLFFFFTETNSQQKEQEYWLCCALLAIIRPFCTDLQPCNNQPESILNLAGLALNLFWKINVMGSNRGKYLLQSLYAFVLFTVIYQAQYFNSVM